jgi:hypothetical protein
MSNDLAKQAEMIVHSPAHRTALERVESEIVRRIAKTEFDGSLEAERYREKLNLLLYIQQKYKQALVSMIATGQIEDHLLEKKSRFKKGGL